MFCVLSAIRMVVVSLGPCCSARHVAGYCDLGQVLGREERPRICDEQMQYPALAFD